MAELFVMRPLFPGANEIDQLDQLCSVLGTPESSWDEHARRVGYNFPKYVATPLASLLPNINPTAIDLIGKMLSWDPNSRPKATEILAHPFFHGQ